MHRCLRCQKTVGPVVCPLCHHKTAKITRTMLPVVERFYSTGYRSVSAAESLIMTHVDPETMEAVDILYVKVEFSRLYPPEVFPHLPQGFEYWSDKHGKSDICGVTLQDVFPVEDSVLSKEALSGVVAELHSWIIRMDESEIPRVYSLAGLIG